MVDQPKKTHWDLIEQSTGKTRDEIVRLAKANGLSLNATIRELRIAKRDSDNQGRRQ